MVIITATRFPQESASEVGRRFMELAPLPAFMTLQGPFIKGTDQGIKVLEIFKLDESKLSLGIDVATQRCVSYFGIPGYTYEINVYFEAQEALKMIGLA